MLRTALLLPVFLVLHASAQTWELMTPVKTRSELAGVHMVDPTTGFTIDRMLGFILKTTDAGASWERKPFNFLDRPRSLWMWDDQRGIIGANSGRFYHTSNGWATITSVYEQQREEVLAAMSERELDFLRLVCDEAELTYEQIADRMGVNARTVDGHRESLFSKFNIKSKPGLVIFAYKWGLLKD